MKKKAISLLLIGLMFLIVGPQQLFASSREEKRARVAQKVKEGVAKLGTGSEARVEIKLYDGAKLKGYISDAAEDHFVVTDASSNISTSIAYAQVKQIKGNNLSTGAKIAIGIGIGVGVFLIIVLILHDRIVSS